MNQSIDSIAAEPAASPAPRVTRRLIVPTALGVSTPSSAPGATTALADAAEAALIVTPTASLRPGPCWTVLVVDDEPAIHQVTRLALNGSPMLGAELRLLHATSAAAAAVLLAEHADVALILLDVVMEHDNAGLEFVRHVREDLGNSLVRIVLRTGQPGHAPERDVMVEFDINDYKEKTELTASRLFTTVLAGVRAYRDLRALRRTQAGLAAVVESSALLFAKRDSASFATEVMRELARHAYFEAGAFVEASGAETTVLAAAAIGAAGPFEITPDLFERLRRQPQTLLSGGAHTHVTLLRTHDGVHVGVGLRASRTLEADERQVLELYLRNAAIAFENLQLERQANVLARLPGELPEPILRVSADGTVLFANVAAAGLLAHWQTERGGRVPPAWRTRLREILALDRRLDSELSFDDRILEMSLSPVVELGYVNIFGRDVTEYRDAVSRLQHAAFHDELTGLHNRVHFRAALEAAIATAAQQDKPIGLLLIDLDQFKQINDTLGHAAGDEALRIAGRRLLQMVRTGDIVARLGGDEFAVLVHQMDQPGELTGLAERLRAGLSLPMQLGTREWTGGASIGLTACPRDASSASDLLRCADLAMYHAKRDAGTGVSAYDGEVHKSVRQRTSVEMLLRDALKHDRMELHFQPLVDLADGRVLGAEALVRMRQTDGTMVSPAEFIPVAEECGLIDQLGEWVLRQALTETRRWHDGGRPDFRIAVNVSGRQLRSPDMVTRFREILDATGVDSAKVEFELTESVLIGNIKDALARIWDLRGLGATLSIDDFGTGYSSLGYLRSLPVSKLKIDRSFVMDLPGSRDALAIVDAVISLSSSLRLSVVAEGVETPEQAAALRKLGCAQGQGYLFSRPVPAADFGRLLDLDVLPMVASPSIGTRPKS